VNTSQSTKKQVLTMTYTHVAAKKKGELELEQLTSVALYFTHSTAEKSAKMV
jgi:hypothetical protein